MPYINLQSIPQTEPVEGAQARFVHSENMTLAFWKFTSGAVIPEHAHPHEQVSVVTQGRFELTIEGEKKTMEPGMVAVIPSHARHSGKALTDCEITDTFYPVREEYKK